MTLNDINYDLSTAFSYINNSSPYTFGGTARTFTAADLTKRYPIYKDLFERIAASQGANATKGVRRDVWGPALETNISTDPVTVYRFLTSMLRRSTEYINPYANTPTWARKILGEVWEQYPDATLTNATVPPNPSPFFLYARNKIDEVTKQADTQFKAFASGSLRLEEFAVNGVAYTAKSINLNNTNAQNGTPFATITATDRFGKTGTFVYIPESYLMTGQRGTDRTYINTNFLNKDFLGQLNPFTVQNRNFGEQYLGGQRVYNNSALSNLTSSFGSNGFLISQSDLQSKFPTIANSFFQSQGWIGDATLKSGEVKQRDANLVSFAGGLAYKTTGYLSYQRMNYIYTGVSAPIIYPTLYDDVGMDAYITGTDYGNDFSYEKVGSGYLTRKGIFAYDTIRLIPEPQKPDWGAFLATGLSLYLAGSGLMSAIASASGAAATTSFATTVGQAMGLTGTAASVVGGAVIGATIYGAVGADPVTGAIVGGIGEFAAASNYAEPVGRALGATTTSSAIIVGNVAISAALSGLKAAVLDQDVGKSMLAGGVVGGLQAASSDIASTLVGGSENLQQLADSLGFYGDRGIAQLQSIITNSLAQGIVAEISGTQQFGEAVVQSLVAGGVSTKVANEVVSGFKADTPTTRAIFDATRQMTSVAITAQMNNQNIDDALSAAAPGIILQSFKTITTPDKEVLDQIAKEKEEDLVETTPDGEQIGPAVPPSDLVQEPTQDVGVDVAGPVSPEILGRLESMPLFGETVVSEQFIDNPDPEIGGRLIRRIQGFRNDGTPYSYDIATFEDGTVVYSTVVDGEVQILDARPDLKNSAFGVGDVQEGAAEGTGTGAPGAPAVDTGTQPPPPIVDPSFTIGFDLRTYGPGSPTSPNLAVFEIGGGRGTPGGSSTDTTFRFVSRDTVTGQETYDVGGKQYNLIILPDKQVLIPTQPSEVVVYLERDPVTNLPKMKEVPVTQVPQEDAVQIAAKVEETSGGAPTGEEGAAGGQTGQEPSAPTEAEQLQPGVTPESPAPGTQPDDSQVPFPETVSGEAEPTIPEGATGGGAQLGGEEEPTGGGGIGDEITDEDLLQIIQDELDRLEGAGEGEGAPGEEGEGTGEGEEGEGPGAGEEGEGEGAGGEGIGVGEGEGAGAGEGGEVAPETPEETATGVPPAIISIGKRLPTRQGEAAPYRVTGQDESGILGRKQPLFGGDEDLQRAEWNRRSLRLRRLLGL